MEENSPRDLFAPLLENDPVAGIFLLVARLFTTTIFIYFIAVELLQPARIQAEMAKHNIPGELVYFALAIQIAGCLFVALGYKTRFAALLLAVFCIVATLVFNWGSIVNGSKDFGIAGGLFFMFAYGPGPISVDALLGRANAAASGEGSYHGVFSSVLKNKSVMGPLLLAGRSFAAVIFLIFGQNKVIHNAQMQAYMVKHNAHVPTLLIFPALVLQLVGGLMLMFGYKTRYAAISLAGFCLIATLLFHFEFNVTAEVIQFMKDFSLAGSLMFMFANGPGPLSADARQGRSNLNSERV